MANNPRVRRSFFFIATLLVLAMATRTMTARAEVVTDPKSAPRVQFGAAKLTEALKASAPADQHAIRVRTVAGLDQGPEGFRIESREDGSVTVEGADDSGTLYGCLELARLVHDAKALPTKLHVAQAPAMKLRGPCIGMQKTFILPGRKVYEYPYTPELFPFFYDKAFWQEYLDFLAENRMNTLYLWNGHPFSSLVKLADYPYALEVPEDVFQKNQEMYRYIAQEADKRGIWLVQMFYNIILSKPFAEKNGLETQLKAPDPVASDYTRKSIAEFMKQYPHVGLMVCMGEALQGNDNQREWLTKTILPGIKDGMKQAGLTEEPPVVIRTHATDLRVYMADALKLYKNIYTEAKFNGESLTTWEPRGRRQEVHLAMSRLGSTHLINIHILANLEPFRYGAQRFIQKSVQAGRDRLGAKGVHLYPLFYWNWPDSPDKVDPPLKQWHRDWIWFEAWGRYAWDPDIPADVDHTYWIDRLTDMYGTKEASEKILAAYNDSGECAPRLLRRFGITEGNRQTLSLGMTLDELVNPRRYGEFEELWESQAPPGERLVVYAEREWTKQPHEGETPVSIIKEVLDFSQKAVASIDGAKSQVTKNKDEYERLRTDVRCIRAMSQNYAAKANAAICVLRYNYSNDVADMQKAATYLAESLDHYRELTKLTTDAYRFANSMQTSQRKIPVPGGSGGKPANYHWSQLLPQYEKELADFQAKVAALKPGVVASQDSKIAPLRPAASFKVLTENVKTYEVRVGAKVFSDRDYAIKAVAPELVGLTGIRIADEAARNDKYEPIEFETAEPVQILIGYIKSDEKGWRKSPNLETDALAAEHGGSEPLILSGVTVETLPPVDVHALTYDKGRHKLEPRGSGSFVILGVVPQSSPIAKRDAHLPAGAAAK